jgi:hypothetical protein
MTKYWMSWYEKAHDPRPITYPPNEAILGWWNSGQRCSDNAFTICALVKAESPELAWQAIEKDWPQKAGFEERFCEARPDDYALGDRFVVDQDWMKERLA